MQFTECVDEMNFRFKINTQNNENFSCLVLLKCKLKEMQLLIFCIHFAKQNINFMQFIDIESTQVD